MSGIHTYDQGHIYQHRDGESVLDALLRGGANVTFSGRKAPATHASDE